MTIMELLQRAEMCMHQDCDEDCQCAHCKWRKDYAELKKPENHICYYIKAKRCVDDEVVGVCGICGREENQ